jgi:hypothetical protein
MVKIKLDKFGIYFFDTTSKKRILIDNIINTLNNKIENIQKLCRNCNCKNEICQKFIPNYNQIQFLNDNGYNFCFINICYAQKLQLKTISTLLNKKLPSHNKKCLYKYFNLHLT